MTLRPAALYASRTVWLVLLVALTGVLVWMLATWDRSGPDVPAPEGEAAALSLVVEGAVSVEAASGAVVRLVVPLTVQGAGDSIALGGASGRVRAETVLGDGATAAVPALGYDVRWLDGDGDDALDAGEHAELTVELPAGSSVRAENPLRLVVMPADGASLTIEDVLPQR